MIRFVLLTSSFEDVRKVRIPSEAGAAKVPLGAC